MSVLDWVRNIVRIPVHGLAVALNRVTNGKLSPNLVTLFGFAMHLPIAYLIATGHHYWAAGLLVIFGLFDALDGELARLQKRASNAGMLLDASTDRMKEVLLYTGASYSFVAVGQPYMAAWAVLACGASLCVSYIKAKGETAVAGGSLTANQVNRLFQDGVARFEIRMFVLVVGLLSSQLVIAVAVIAVLSVFTAFQRLIKISRALNSV